MTDTTKRMKTLQDGLVPREQALQVIAPFESCQEVTISGKADVIVDPASSGDNYILKNQGREFSLTDSSFMKLNRLCGITEVYARKVPKNLLFPHLAYWLGEGGVTVKAFTRGNSGERPAVAGFAKEDAYYYPVSRVLEQLDKIDPEYSLEGLDDISWRNTTFGVVFPKFEFNIKDEVSKGDWVYGGIKIKMSLLGEFATRISAFFLTLACLNGMISMNEVFVYNRKNGLEGQDAFLVDGLQMALGALSTEVQRVQDLKKVTVNNEHITNYIGQIFDQMSVNQKSRLAVLEKVIEKQPENLYDLMNTVTSVANTIENRVEAYHLQSVGGYIVQHAESCKTCHRPY